MSRPVRVAVSNDYPEVVTGIASALMPFDHLEIAELDLAAPPQEPVDVILYDTFGQERASHIDLSRFTAHDTSKVVVLTWSEDEGLVQGVLRRGVAGYIAKGATPEEVAEAIKTIAEGDSVVLRTDATQEFGGWPGSALDLESREAELLALLTRGYTDAEICDRVNIDQVELEETLDHVFDTIGVADRPQAILFGIHNGFDPSENTETLPVSW